VGPTQGRVGLEGGARGQAYAVSTRAYAVFTRAYAVFTRAYAAPLQHMGTAVAALSGPTSMNSAFCAVTQLSAAQLRCHHKCTHMGVPSTCAPWPCPQSFLTLAHTHTHTHTHARTHARARARTHLCTPQPRYSTELSAAVLPPAIHSANTGHQQEGRQPMAAPIICYTRRPCWRG